MLLAFSCAIAALQPAPDAMAQVGAQPVVGLPTIVVDRDDVVIDRSCIIVIEPGAVIPDANGDGVIKIVTPDIRVEFAEGSALWGSPRWAEPQTRAGTGIRIDGVAGVELVNARVHGFKVGVHATAADRLVVRDADLSDNFAQKLDSTAAAEDSGDWLWPHANDEQQWRTNYGAALCIERTAGAEVSGLRVRRSQNGIILDRVTNSVIKDNDCSFLSGWGLAMWRSSHNWVERNRFDFCVRGYSHGVYNRGQDSAGILAFEQCSHNIFSHNSATHGGDGFFGFAGREALGEPASLEGFNHEQAGCNFNIFENNDFSYAPAHGLEMTFSFGNIVVQNRMVGNAICGVWGGYSQDTRIAGNYFADNGQAGYGLERGGVNIEHGFGNLVVRNAFVGDEAGVHLWFDEHGNFAERPWGAANYPGSALNVVRHNRFVDVDPALHLRGGIEVEVGGNAGLSDETTRLEQESRIKSIEVDGAEAPEAEDVLKAAGPDLPSRGLEGREHIIMGQWFPYDFERPTVRVAEHNSDSLRLEFFAPGNEPAALMTNGRVTSEGVTSAVSVRSRRQKHEPQTVMLVNSTPGVHPYEVTVVSGEHRWPFSGVFVNTSWDATAFAYTVDPREDLEAWRQESAGGTKARLSSLNLPFGSRGPASIRAFSQFGFDSAVRDRFGIIARTEITLPAGQWRLRTRSDDGVRVLVDGETIIENWTHHGATWDEGVVTLEAEKRVPIVVEYFELDGAAVLEFQIEPVAGG